MISLWVSLVVFAVPPTRAESTEYVDTGRYAEVEALCAAFPKAYPGKVKCEKFGTTPLGRSMWSLIASADGTFAPADTAKKQRPVVLLQGGIHAGEIDGKDAGFELLRDLLDGKIVPGALSKLTLVFVPVFNVDGHERFGPNNRPNQNGPALMGWRVTSHNLNLNRDYMKADAPEMHAMLQLLHRYDPVLYVDLHVTDGAKFQHDVSVTFEPWATGPQGLRALGKAMRVELFAELEQKGHLPVGFYPAFIKEDDPLSGFEYGWPPPRFGNAYWTANNRFGLLVETHSWKNYKTRVRATYDVCAGLVRIAAADGGRWLKAGREADAEDEKKAGADVVLLYDNTKVFKEIEFQGYAFTREKSSVSGKEWVRYDDSKPLAWKVPLFEELVPALTVKVPRGGYIVPPQYAALVQDKLKLHALQFVVLKEGISKLDVEQIRLSVQTGPQSYEGRMVARSQGQWSPGVTDVSAGSLFVPANQPRVGLLLHLLEPTAPDSLMAWGFFLAHMEQKEYLEDYLTEAYARQLLEDPQVKKEFDEKLKDEAFAKSPEARLKFFSQRHPSFDSQMNVYPILRTDQPLSAFMKKGR